MWEKGCRFYLGLLAAAGAMVALTCGGNSGGPSSPSPPGGGGQTFTVTITSEGVNPKDLNVPIGARVTFRNQNNRPHEVQSNPHDAHTDCPAVNAVGLLNPNQERMTNPLGVGRVCGYHDHLDDLNQAFRGRILVGGAEPDPGDPYGGSGGS